MQEEDISITIYGYHEGQNSKLKIMMNVAMQQAE
jgi:hypothetical protein